MTGLAERMQQERRPDWAPYRAVTHRDESPVRHRLSGFGVLAAFNRGSRPGKRRDRRTLPYPTRIAFGCGMAGARRGRSVLLRTGRSMAKELIAIILSGALSAAF